MYIRRSQWALGAMAVTVVLGMASSAAAVPVPACTADYRFDNNFNDSSGNGYHASIGAGSVTFTTDLGQLPGYQTPGGLWPMNVSTADYLTVQNSGPLGNVAPSSSLTEFGFTAATMFKLDFVTGKGSKYWIVDKLDTTAKKGWGMFVETGDRRPYLRFYEKDAKEKNFSGDNDVDNGEWWHLAVVYQFRAGGVPGAPAGETMMVKWYMNGSCCDTYWNYDQLLTNDSTVLLGGESSSPGGRDMAGVLDHLQIWHQALTPLEVGQVYDDALHGVPEPAAFALLVCGLPLLLRRRR